MNGAASLVDTLEGLGVSVSLTQAGKIAVEPASLIPAELKDMLKTDREAVAEFLAARESENKTPETPETPGRSTQTAETVRCFSGVSENRTPGTPADLPRLPDRLALMVRAASAGQVHGGASLAGGRVTDLGEYVLAWAAAYLTGDRAHALTRLEEARAAWQAKT